MSYQPRTPSSFVAADGSPSYTFPLDNYEWETQQGLQVPVSGLVGAHYAYDHLGYRPGLSMPANERLRFDIQELSPTLVDSELDDMKSALFSIGRGRLFATDSVGVQRWAWARLVSMPTTRWRAGDIFKMATSLEFRRNSDWYGATQRFYEIDVGQGVQQAGFIWNNGNANVYNVELRLKSLANFQLKNGVVMTDGTRALATSGDGLAIFQSDTGIFRATTNLEPNGGFETNATGWATGGANTIVRSSEQKKFGSWSLKCTYQNSLTLAFDTLTLTAVAHSLSGWVYIPSGWDGGTVRISCANFTGISGTLVVDANMALRDQWQRLELPNVTPAGGDLVGNPLNFVAATNPSAGKFIYVDGGQVEAQVYPTPYVHTDGGTASRVATDIDTPVGSMNNTWGWCAMRVRLPYTDEQYDLAGLLAHFFDWRQDANNFINLYYDGDAKTFIGRIRSGGVIETVASAVQNFTAMSDFTVIFYWTLTQLGISINGGTFVTAVRAQAAPVLAVADFDIGHVAGLFQIDAYVRWMAFGTAEPPTNADAVVINGWGNTDPSRDDEQWPGLMSCIKVWTGDGVGSGTAYYTNPSITNFAPNYSVATTRDSVAAGDELKIDSGKFTVERSTDEGVTYANDMALVTRGALQSQLMLLEPGSNSLIIAGSAASNYVLEVRYYEAFK